MLQSHYTMSESGILETTPKIRIVIIEKHAAVRRALRKRLSATPHLEVIASVQDPAEALPFLMPGDNVNGCNGVADVVLWGLQNEPDEQLFKTLEIVRQMVRFPAAVIVLAPYADEVERLLLQQAGVSSYLLKYIDSHHLIQEIESASHHDPNLMTRRA